MAKDVFDNVVSLGGSCKGAYEARAHFDFGEAYPFDWWISRADQIARYIMEPNPEALYALENLELLGAGVHVMSVTHDFRFQHEFPRDWAVAGEPVSSSWESTVAQPLERHRSLLARFLGLDTPGRRILFIRTCEWEGDTAAIGALIAALEHRFSRTAWTLLVINPEPMLEPDPRILTAWFPLEELKWTGFPAEPWQRTFTSLGLAMKPSAKRFPRELRAEHDV